MEKLIRVYENNEETKITLTKKVPSNVIGNRGYRVDVNAYKVSKSLNYLTLEQAIESFNKEVIEALNETPLETY